MSTSAGAVPVRTPTINAKQDIRVVHLGLDTATTPGEFVADDGIDFSVITAADIALLESVAATGVDNLDYSAFYAEDD